MSDPSARSSSYLESDEMNSLLHNLLQSSFAHQPFSTHPPPHAPAIGADDTSVGLNFSDPGQGFMADARVYDIDEFDSDCKGAEVSEGPSDPTTRRSAKRTRAADVHNLSEKRRRSRINEKMKALQKLIPNSNKTDKASMLDEAIEYLKQLQLQVQMLSMRNGVSLFPYCSPVPHPGIAIEEHQLLPSRVDTFSRNKEIPLQVAFDQGSSSSQPNLFFPSSDINHSKASFGSETSVRQHFHTLNHLASSKDICQVSQLHLDMKCLEKNSPSGVSS